MIATICSLTVDLSKLISVELVTGYYDYEENKVIITLRSSPEYVWNPELEVWEYHNENAIIERKYKSAGEASFVANEWKKEWKKYKKSLDMKGPNPFDEYCKEQQNGKG